MNKININYENIGKNIKKLRLKNGYTQEELSELVDITCSYVGQIERNERKISIDKLYKIANVFNVSIDSIIEKTSEDKQKTNKKDLMLKEIWEVIKKYDNKL